jgi:hypothetical protein
LSSHQFRGKPAPRQARRAGFSQASTRRGITLYDQHDREWTTMVDLKSGMPTGQIVPSFQAPFIPDQQYLVVNPDNTSELYIDYESMLRHRHMAMENHHKTAVKMARQRKIAIPQKGDYPEELVEVIGNPPKPVEPVVAAMQDNVYILGPNYARDRGLRYVVDKRLEKFTQVVTETDRLLEQYDFGSSSEDEPVERIDITPAGRQALAEPGETDLEDEEELEEMDLGTSDETSVDSMLDDLDEEFDQEAVGGRTVAPQNQDRAARQAPRRGNASPVRSRHGKARSQSGATKSQREGRPSLADGAAPVIGDETA